MKDGYEVKGKEKRKVKENREGWMKGRDKCKEGLIWKKEKDKKEIWWNLSFNEKDGFKCNEDWWFVER